MTAEMKREAIQEFDLKPSLAAATFSGIMSSCFAYGLAAGIQSSNSSAAWNRHPVARATRSGGLPYENRLAERSVSDDEAARMLAAEATERDALLLRLLHGAGRRVSELCVLRWRNLRRRGDAGHP